MKLDINIETLEKLTNLIAEQDDELKVYKEALKLACDYLCNGYGISVSYLDEFSKEFSRAKPEDWEEHIMSIVRKFN